MSISLPVCTTSSDWDIYVLDWFPEKVWELASGGRIADAKYIAAAIPSGHGPTEAYVRIAEIQRDDGDGPGATETLQEVLAHVDQSDSPVDKAYCFSLIAAAFAQNGDNTNAIDASTRCHRALTAVDMDRLQESDDRETAARTYAKLAHTSALLEEPKEAKRRLAQADSILAKTADGSAYEDARGDIAEVWMCLNEQGTALAVAEAPRNQFFKGIVIASVISHPSFSATPEVTDHILAGLVDAGEDWDGDARNAVLLAFVRHHLCHGRVAQAQDLAETIGCEVDRDWAYSAIIEKQCELGAIDQAIDIAARIDYHWKELEVFQMIGKTLAKSRSIAELESFLTAQSKPT